MEQEKQLPQQSLHITTMGIFFHIFRIEAIPYLPFLCLVVASYLLIISWIKYYITFINEYKTLR